MTAVTPLSKVRQCVRSSQLLSDIKCRLGVSILWPSTLFCVACGFRSSTKSMSMEYVRVMFQWTLLVVPRHNTRVNASQYCMLLNTLRTGDADLRFYITTVQDVWRKSAFLTRGCFPCTVHLIMQYIEPVSEWSCWRMFIETWPHSELTFRHRACSI